jgi:hypothetical protein
MPKRSPWRQFDTLRNRLIKLVTEVTETADRIRIALAPVFPVEDRNVSMIMRQALVQFKLGSSGSL